MPRSTERVALRLLKALKDEWAREPDFLKCRALGDVASKICRSQDEYDRVVKFITSQSMIEAVRREGRLVAKPSGAGLAWIESHKEKWNPQARVALLALIWAMGLAVVGLLVKWLLRGEE
jgi:hypothetical protein